MGSALRLRSPAVLMTVIGVGATLVVTAAVVVVLLLFGSGAKAVSDNAALIGALVALGGVFTTQLVNSALEAQRAEQARKTEEAQRERDREIAQAQRERELEVGSQRAQDDAAQAYLDQMAALLLDKDRPLRSSEAEDEVRTLARARTLTVLSRLDGTRKANVVQFLYDSHLITKGQVLVDLGGADLSEANLSESYLEGGYLSSTVLSGANLSEAELTAADLSWDNLSWANLSGADLSGADMREANLRGAEGITNEELEQQAESLEGATMPDGHKYEVWLNDREGRKQNE